MSRAKTEAPHIEKRPGRKNYYAWISRTDKNRSLGTDDPVLAQAKLLEILRERGLPSDAPVEVAAFGVGDLFLRAEKEIVDRTENGTSPGYISDLKRISGFLEARGIDDPRLITRAIVSDYVGFRRDPSNERDPRTIEYARRYKFKAVSAARTNRELTSLARAMRIAVEMGIVPASIIQDIYACRPPEAPRKQRHVILTPEEIARFLVAVPDERYRAFFVAIRGTGMRIGEMAHYEARDVESHEFTVNPKPPGWCACHPRGWSVKAHRARTVPCGPETAAMLGHVLEYRRAYTPTARGERRKQVAALAAKLRELRTAAKMTLGQVADAIGCSVTNVHHYENAQKGKVPPDERCAKLEKLYGCEPGTIARLAVNDTTFSLDPKKLDKVIKRALAVAGIQKKATLHSFRRAWATAMLDAGIAARQRGEQGWTIVDVSRWLGHKDVATTEHYLGLGDKASPAAHLLPFA
jgi:integrase